MMLKLYEIPFSHHCVKIRLALNYKAVPFERVNVKYHDKRNLIEASGQDVVPFISDGKDKVAYYGKTDMIDWVEAKWPLPALYPKDVRGQAKLIENWAHEVLEEAVFKTIIPDLAKKFRAKDDVEGYVFEWLKEMQRGPWEEIVWKAANTYPEKVKPLYGWLEESLKGHDYILGEPSAADFAAYGAIFPLYFVGKEVPKDYPRLREWKDRLSKLDA
ncbi:MAG: glutathione S-transferase family protein [Euryarchaeota archaeon]|nr:glutathione S-transferase family protein [Euryarchaeota archaeon]